MIIFRAEKSAKNAGIALELFRNKNLPVIQIQHISLQEVSVFFLPDTDGKAIYDGVKLKNNEMVFIKHRPDTFFQTRLHENLEKGCKGIAICGMKSHLRIDTNDTVSEKSSVQSFAVK